MKETFWFELVRIDGKWLMKDAGGSTKEQASEKVTAFLAKYPEAKQTANPQ